MKESITKCWGFEQVEGFTKVDDDELVEDEQPSWCEAANAMEILQKFAITMNDLVAWKLERILENFWRQKRLEEAEI